MEEGNVIFCCTKPLKLWDYSYVTSLISSLIGEIANESRGRIAFPSSSFQERFSGSRVCSGAFWIMQAQV